LFLYRYFLEANLTRWSGWIFSRWYFEWARLRFCLVYEDGMNRFAAYLRTGNPILVAIILAVLLTLVCLHFFLTRAVRLVLFMPG